METDGWDEVFRRILSFSEDDGYGIDKARIIPGLTAYLVRSFDGEALLFSIPLLFRRNLLSETELDRTGSDGAVSMLIERIKERALTVPGLAPLSGKGIVGSSRYCDTIEPYTVIHSPDAIGSHLWKADARNFCDEEGVHLVTHGALPCPSGLPAHEMRTIQDRITDLAAAINSIVQAMPFPLLQAAWLASLDQKLLRSRLTGHGLVSFVGDGSCLARHFTQHRAFFRVAGPKEGISVPFRCPGELKPVELELPASNRTVTGLGIRRCEVFAIAGSNAQGKTTFLDGILAGMDDHAPHDGRELVVTVRGACCAESTNMGLAGADISMFFHALPPGVSGTVHAVHGTGSGSMTMASMIQHAVVRKAPLLIIDEDRAAPNLLVKSCLQKEEVTPLAEILSRHRERMGITSLVFAACAMDTLIARADRIMVLDRHEASAIAPEAFRHMVAVQLRRTADDMEY